jgi:RNA polymerase sigma factor for flagellar operon FliA
VGYARQKSAHENRRCYRQRIADGEMETAETVQESEVNELWRRYEVADDEAARERLVVAYAPLVKYVVDRLKSGLPAHVDEAEVISYGLSGLSRAVERFDLSRRMKFETYAIGRIRGEILDELRRLDLVPRSVRVRTMDIERAITKLVARLQRVPTDAEVATEFVDQRREVP